MLPITELRAAIPWAILIQKIPWHEAAFYSILGNFLITIPILYFLEPISNKLRHFYFMDKFLNWLFIRTRKKGKLIEKLEFYGLIIFVGIPLPVTGAWTGCLAAHIFGIQTKKAFLAIFTGLCLSASIVTTLTLLGYLIIQ